MNETDGAISGAPHASEAGPVLAALGTSEQGLNDTAVRERLAQYGPNSLPVAAPTPAWKRFFTQFNNLLIYILIASAIISLFLQHYVDSGVIMAVVLVNAIVGYVQEGKAEAALRSILSMVKTHCTVVRDGVSTSVDSAALVPGDIVALQAGDRVPADLRLFYNKSLHCDESALTGESQPVAKQTGVVAASAPLAERRNMAYMGTMVTFGTARGVVCRTGSETEIGTISKLVRQTPLVPTPLQRQLKHFARQLSVAILALAVGAMLFGVLFRDYTLAYMFQAAISIAVAAIPEGLPAIVTITLAIGVQRMARNNALVRRLPSVEVLGSVDVICSDKTGTLTTNAMTAREVVHASRHYKISGEGYEPAGEIRHSRNSHNLCTEDNLCAENDLSAEDSLSAKDDLSVDGNHDHSLDRAALIAMLCNDATIRQSDGEWRLQGNPTEGALLAFAMKHGHSRQHSQRDWPRIDELPFETERRYMATLHSRGSQGNRDAGSGDKGTGDDGHGDESKASLLLAIKGAPERLIPWSKHQLSHHSAEPIDRAYWERQLNALAERGMRVMALAQKELPPESTALDHDSVEGGLTLVALVGISDPPRPEAIDSIRQCHAAGITVKMITGDSACTARAIGRELGLRAERVVTGSELEKLSPDALLQVANDVDIFARATPTNKIQLIDALQHSKHVGAMTGDGVNDAPALRRANIGVAMGKKGTDAAKEAADIVLLDDNFQTIAKAVEEGRTVYDNIVKSILFILPTSLAEALVVIVAIVIGGLLPITPVQILWVNMVTAVTLALALAFEPSEPDIMTRPPRPRHQGFITLNLLTRISLVGFTSAAIVFSLFTHYQSLDGTSQSGVSVEFARTVAVNMLVMIEAIYLINCRLLQQSIFTPAIVKGAWPSLIAIASVVLLQLCFTYLPVSQRIFGVTAITGNEWLLIAGLTLPVLLVVELEKLLWRRLVRHGRARGTAAVGLPRG